MKYLTRDILKAPDLSTASELLRKHLGLETALSPSVTRRALEDPVFAKALYATRKLPGVMKKLTASAEQAARPSSMAVTAKAAAGVLKWGMEGLEHAKPWDITRRLGACRSCPFEAPTPDMLVYRGAKVVVGKDAKICTSCHCLTNTKAAMARERCPEKDPNDPRVSRWGEPWEPPKVLPGSPWAQGGAAGPT
ncbi:hypothetical protein [Mangrovicoccus sp. HB161399]|uniref:hypothetical protein n=1 Tax=Mangrovicoccus sp. HB161399 TaxID=2720392 RepID=UPI0015532E94|nr:hypothetical protein [Mangrovicoccus sp. HB161399]